MGLVAFVALSAVGTAQTRPKDVPLGTGFELTVGESARLQGEQLLIGLEDVLSDSRCPKGEQCIRAGDATVRVWLQKGSDARVTRELRTTETDDEGVSVLNYAVRLEGLAPYPIAGRPIAKGDYVATLVVARDSVAAPAPGVR